MSIIIRNETPADYRAVENLTRESFWNVYRPAAQSIMFCTAIAARRTLCLSWIL